MARLQGCLHGAACPGRSRGAEERFPESARRVAWLPIGVVVYVYVILVVLAIVVAVALVVGAF
jgi:hypothetical protein